MKVKQFPSREIIQMNKVCGLGQNNNRIPRLLIFSFTIWLSTVTIALADYQNPAFDRGMAHMEHRDYDGAIIDFGEAIGFNDTNPKNFLMRGQCFFHTHDYELAIQDFNKSLEFAPKNSETYLWRGTTHANLGKDDFAIKDYERAIKLDPDLADRFFSQKEARIKIHQQGKAQFRNGRAQVVGSNRSYETKSTNENAIRDYEQAMTLVYPDRMSSQKSSQSWQNDPDTDTNSDTTNN